MTASAAPASIAPRIAYRQPVSPTGFVDAAWWPRSRDLDAELPTVLADLAAAGRPIVRVIYDLDFWQAHSRRLAVDGQQVKLGGFRNADHLLITFIENQGRARIDVLVIDPDADAGVAERAMELASSSGNLARPAAIMTEAGAAE